MFGLGFHHSRVRKIMGCIETVSYHFIQKGEYMGPIKPSRGLRQGDPLSPFLYILSAEGLSSSIQALERKGLIHGCKMAGGAPEISHLFFVDDSYMFFKADVQEGYQVKHCLEQYEKASGQMVNFEKSTISFSSNVSNQLKGEIRSF